MVATSFVTLAGVGYAMRQQWLGDGLRNDCRAELPPALARHELVAATWAGLDPANVWDSHVHLVGTGDSGSGITVNSAMSSPGNPRLYAQFLFYLNASCVHDAPGRVDDTYVARLLNLIDAMPTGFKALLFSFDAAHSLAGQKDREQTMFEVPSDHVAEIARLYPRQFEWVASIHPYRPDAIDALKRAAMRGARAVKWLPNAMLIDPSSRRCDTFYAALVALDLPLISHGGAEMAVHSPQGQSLGNPLLLRRALEAGVRVVIAHCASLGEDIDLDQGAAGPVVPAFQLFARLMDEPRHAGRVFGDLSAVVLRNRDPAILRTLLTRDDWHDRLINGSDYPLPGILPLVLLDRFVGQGLLAESAVQPLREIREHNPLLFDLALKRQITHQAKRWPPSVFNTRRHFDRTLRA